MKELGQALRRVRREHGLTRLQLEELSGVHRNTIERAERDASTLTIFKLQCLCEAMGESIASVMARVENSPRIGYGVRATPCHDV